MPTQHANFFASFPFAFWFLNVEFTSLLHAYTSG
jgi:hypothetical protein